MEKKILLVALLSSTVSLLLFAVFQDCVVPLELERRYSQEFELSQGNPIQCVLDLDNWPDDRQAVLSLVASRFSDGSNIAIASISVAVDFEDRPCLWVPFERDDDLIAPRDGPLEYHLGYVTGAHLGEGMHISCEVTEGKLVTAQLTLSEPDHDDRELAHYWKKLLILFLGGAVTCALLTAYIGLCLREWYLRRSGGVGA